VFLRDNYASYYDLVVKNLGLLPVINGFTSAHTCDMELKVIAAMDGPSKIDFQQSNMKSTSSCSTSCTRCRNTLLAKILRLVKGQRYSKGTTIDVARVEEDRSFEVVKWLNRVKNSNFGWLNFLSSVKFSAMDPVLQNRQAALTRAIQDSKALYPEGKVGERNFRDGNIEYPNTVYKTQLPYRFRNELCHYVAITIHDPCHNPPPQRNLPHVHVRPVIVKENWSGGLAENIVSIVVGDKQYYVEVDRQDTVPNCSAHYYYN